MPGYYDPPSRFEASGAQRCLLSLRLARVRVRSGGRVNHGQTLNSAPQQRLSDWEASRPQH
eukprot:2245927-Rhodomonas_salina.1